jgi:hypothetical protein
MVCAAELLNGNLLRDADFDSLFLCTAFHEIYQVVGPKGCWRQESPGQRKHFSDKPTIRSSDMGITSGKGASSTAISKPPV